MYEKPLDEKIHFVSNVMIFNKKEINKNLKPNKQIKYLYQKENFV